MSVADMAAVPDFQAGAMENWGLILYRETALLYDPRESSTSNKQRVAVVVSHELAHQVCRAMKEAHWQCWYSVDDPETSWRGEQETWNFVIVRFWASPIDFLLLTWILDPTLEITQLSTGVYIIKYILKIIRVLYN